MKRSFVAVAAFAVLSLASGLSAQDARAGRAAKRAEAARGAGRAGPQQPLVRELRQRFNGVVQKQLNLSDANARRLESVDRQFQQQRAQLNREAKEARLGLRAALADSTNLDQAKIGEYMDELTREPRRRADILEAEQKELATFLTPVQRAKLQGLREQLAQRVKQIQQQNGGRKGVEP
jgi:Spy/CpxP family protein refolding chaperone